MQSNTLISLIKKKGTGKSMSKHLDADDLAHLTLLLNNASSHSQTGLATLFTALIMLDKKKEEQAFLNALKLKTLPKLLQAMLIQDQQQLSDSHIKLLNGQDLNTNNIKDSLNKLIDPHYPEPLKAVLLEGLRLKEESQAENIAFLDFFYQKSQRITCDIPLVIDIANPYDGFTRFEPIQLFSSVILAACGFPCVLHGVSSVGPKYGITIKTLLEAAGKTHNNTLEQAKQDLENPNKAWTYIDQHQFCPALYQLQDLRNNMVKRPVLATIEKFLSPCIAKQNLILTGYTHPAYRQKSIRLLQHLAHQPDFILIRGQEGSSQAPLDRQSPYITPTNKENNKNVIKNKILEDFCKPENYDLNKIEKIKAQTLSPEAILKEGLKTLQNQASTFTNSILYQCYISLNKLGIPFNKSKDMLHHILKSGQAFTQWKAL
eukprot:COSAG01_NODE_128_length_24936_cov_324.347264_4_plen_432_part_00